VGFRGDSEGLTRTDQPPFPENSFLAIDLAPRSRDPPTPHPAPRTPT
jgi:hypothetical protein